MVCLFGLELHHSSSADSYVGGVYMTDYEAFVALSDEVLIVGQDLIEGVSEEGRHSFDGRRRVRQGCKQCV